MATVWRYNFCFSNQTGSKRFKANTTAQIHFPNFVNQSELNLNSFRFFYVLIANFFQLFVFVFDSLSCVHRWINICRLMLSKNTLFCTVIWRERSHLTFALSWSQWATSILTFKCIKSIESVHCANILLINNLNVFLHRQNRIWNYILMHLVF